MEIIDRYVYAVVSKLPSKQRDDIEREIRTLIEDMMEEYSDEEAEISKAKKTLLELGDPSILSDNYIDKKRYLIGPKNFNNYVLVLKIVFGAVFLGISIATGIDSIFSPEKSILTMFIGYSATLISALMQAFVWVTLGFGFSEYKGIEMNGGMNKAEKWSLEDLPEIPNKKAFISPVEAIVGIVFSTIFMLVLYFAPQAFGAHINQANNTYVSIPLFNLNVLRGYNSLILIMFIATIGKEVLKLIGGKWNLRLAIMHSVLDVLSLIMFLIIFADANVWNANFAIEISKYMNLSQVFYWQQFINGFLVFVIMINIIDIISVLYKGIKYNSQEKNAMKHQ